MPEPIPASGAINADLIRTNWFRSGEFSLGSYRNLQVWDARSNPNNNNRPYGITNLPSPTISFSDFKGKVEMYAIDYCIISGGGGGGTPVLSTGGVFSGYAGGGGGGGRVITGTTYVPNGGNLANWNRLDIIVGAGGAGGGTSTNGAPFNGGGSFIRQYYTTPSSTQQLENYILSRGGGAGASVNYLAGSEGTGGGGSSFAFNNQGNPPGFGDSSSGGYGQGRYVSNNSFQSLAGGGGGAGGNGYSAITTFGTDPSQMKAGQGGLPVELSNFLGTDPSPYGNAFGAQNRAGGGGGGGAFSRGGDVFTYSTIRAQAQLGGGGAGAAESEPAPIPNGGNPAIHGYVSAENGREYRGGGGGGGAGVYVYNGGSGGSGSIIIRYRNIDNNQRGVGGSVYNVSINGINYYTHIFYGSGSFYFYG